MLTSRFLKTFFRKMIGKSIMFKPATFDAPTFTIPIRDRCRSSLPNVSFSNGSEKNCLPFHSHYMKYIGPLQDGKKHGYGTIRYFITKGGVSNIYIGKYHGKWENGSPVGEGVFNDKKGEISVKGFFTNDEIFSAETLKYNYKGILVNGKREGFGTIKSTTTGNIIYEGEWKNGLHHGYGKFYSPNNGILIYEGQWKHGKKCGLGKRFHKNGEIKYNGNWKKNMRDSFGKHYDNCGRLLYDGQWKKNRRDGFGLLYGQDKKKKSYVTYSGSFKNNKKNGKGISLRPDGEICYEGLFANDRRHGKGIKFSKEGNREDVHYKEGILHGPSTIYENDGKTIKMKGKYIRNKFIDESIFFIRKFLESNDISHLKKISKKDLSRYIQENFQKSSTLRQSKDEMIEMLKLLHFQGKTVQESEAKDDLFGNTIETPCRGNDGEIYDLKSMEYLFETDAGGTYKNIRYLYKNGILVPNFPVMSNGIRLSSFSIMNQQEK